jgi:acetyltransferase/esterase
MTLAAKHATHPAEPGPPGGGSAWLADPTPRSTAMAPSVPGGCCPNARKELDVSTLEVPGAILHYETQGRGPVLVLVPGANGEAGIFKPLADALQDAFTVVRYDRRGFSDSQLTDAQQQGDPRLAGDGDDVARLLTHLGAAGSGFVFGNSSGAVVAMKFLLDHPNTAVKTIAHEPPIVKVLPDADRWRDFFYRNHDEFAESGMAAGMKMFVEHIVSPVDAEMISMGDDPSPVRKTNAQYWVEHELRQYPTYDWDLDAIAAQKGKLLLAAGEHSLATHQWTSRPSLILAERCGLPLLQVPGYHVGFLQYPAEFADKIRTALL